ncbi:PLD nuclease N-terminal domain-containing protein [Streptomyces sioyaensis]|uniref:PLD nuclease N-terminal domain-containing protein n=1 Tax=Streptomyces sioyaensis TaxID=67364 RepID=UPI0033F03B96
MSHEHQIILAAAGDRLLTYAPAAAAVILTLAYVGLFVSALISIIRSALSGGMKLIWVVFAFIAPFIGSSLWFLIGRRDSRRRLATS